MRKLLAVTLIVFVVNLIVPLRILYAEDEDELFPFTHDNIEVDFVRKGEITDKNELIKIQWSLPDENNTYINKITFNEQSTYADWLANHYYYRTIGYRYYLTKEPMLFIDDDFGKTINNIVAISSRFDSTELQSKESELMRQLIEEKFNSAFSELYVTSQTYPAEFFDKLFQVNDVLKLPDVKPVTGAYNPNLKISDANYLIRTAEIQFIKTDSNKEVQVISDKENDGITDIGVALAGSKDDKNNESVEAIVKTVMTKNKTGPIYDDFIPDFLTRTVCIPLKTPLINPPTGGNGGSGSGSGGGNNGITIPFELKQIDIIEDASGNTIAVNIQDASLDGNKFNIIPYSGATMQEWILSTKRVLPFDESNITWDKVKALSKKSAGGPSDIPEISELNNFYLYVRYTVGSQGNNQSVNGNAVLTQKRITRILSLLNLGNLPTFNFSYPWAGKHTHFNLDGTTTDYPRSTPIDDKYEYIIEDTITGSSIAKTGDRFTERFRGTNIKSGTAVWTEGSDSVSPNLYFNIWREKDVPTLASYKESSKNPLISLGLKIGNTPQFTRNNTGGYADKAQIRLDESSKGDYETTFGCSSCLNPKVQEHDTSDSYAADVNIVVQSFIGSQNTGSTVPNPKIASFAIGNVTFNNAKGYVIPHSDFIKFYPYVQMAYDYFDSASDYASVKTAAVNVLAQHESAIKPVDYVEVGWYHPSPANSLGIQSDMWSSYVRAINAFGRNSVLPGGAIYTLSTPVPTKVGVRTWQVYVDESLRKYLTAGNQYSKSEAVNNENNFMKQVKDTLDTLDVVQYVSPNPKASNAFSGVEILAKGGQVLTALTGVKTSTYAKYWLKRGTPKNSYAADEADIDVWNESKSETLYRVRSDVNGNVYIEKSTNSGSSWSNLQTLSKTQTIDNLTNAEAKGLDDRTKIITNFLSALDRNKGNDSSVSNGPTWYNEAWDGIYVLRTDRIMDIGFGKPSTLRSVALDPKLCPPSSDMSDIFTKYYLSQFRLDTKSYLRAGEAAGYLGTLGGVKVYMPSMESMYITRKFWIPNATVMDLDYAH